MYTDLQTYRHAHRNIAILHTPIGDEVKIEVYLVYSDYLSDTVIN